MNRSRLTGQRLIVLAFMAAMLLNYPILSLFNVDERILGAPILYVYLFSVWLVLIGCMAFLIQRKD